MVTPGTVTCPKKGCGEDVMIDEINDPMGKRFFCRVCAHEFTEAEAQGAKLPMGRV